MSALRWSGVTAGVLVFAFTAYWTLVPLEPASALDGRFANNAVLAIEFAQTPADVEAVLGSDPGAPVRQQLDRLNQLDFAYLAAYGWLLACRFLLRGRRALAALPLIAAAADVAENLVLLQLTHAADAAPLLLWLRGFTLLKWELLALVAALLGWQLWRDGGWWRRLCGVCGLLSLPLGVLTVVDAGTFSPALTLAFAPVWLVVFIAIARPHPRSADPLPGGEGVTSSGPRAARSARRARPWGE